VRAAAAVAASRWACVVQATVASHGQQTTTNWTAMRVSRRGAALAVAAPALLARAPFSSPRRRRRRAGQPPPPSLSLPRALSIKPRPQHMSSISVFSRV